MPDCFRYQKCLALGMNPTWVMNQIDREEWSAARNKSTASTAKVITNYTIRMRRERKRSMKNSESSTTSLSIELRPVDQKWVDKIDTAMAYVQDNLEGETHAKEKTCQLIHQNKWLPQDLVETIFKRLKQRGMGFLMTSFSEFSVKDIHAMIQNNGDKALCLDLAHIFQSDDGLSCIFGNTHQFIGQRQKVAFETIFRCPWAANFNEEQEFETLLNEIKSNLDQFNLLYVSVLTYPPMTAKINATVQKVHEKLKDLHARTQPNIQNYSGFYEKLHQQLKKMADILSRRILQDFISLR